MSRLALPLGDSAPLAPPIGRDYNFGILSLGEEVPAPLAQKLQSLSQSESGDPVLGRTSSPQIIARSELPQSGAVVAVQSASSSPSSTCSSPVVIRNRLSNVVSHPGSDSSLAYPVQRHVNATDLGRTNSIPCRTVSGLTVYEAAPPPGALKNLATVRPLPQQGQIQSPRCRAGSEMLSPRIRGSEVILHVYDLGRMTKRLPGMMAFYHMGVEVFKQEIFFSVEGILACKPGGHQTHIHKKTVDLGRTSLDAHQVKAILEQMGQEWKGSCYSLTGRNCQTFAVDFAEKLGLGTNCIPGELHWKWDVHSNSSVGGAALGFLGKMLGSKSGSGSKAEKSEKS